MTDRIEFGFPDFAPTLSATFGPALRLAEAHSHLVNEMLAALPATMKVYQVVIYVLVRMTTTGWAELLILVGNGAGLGAMKISRGMFETAVMAEYLRQVPEEVADYRDYGRILQFKRIKLSPEVLSPERRLTSKGSTIKSNHASKTRRAEYEASGINTQSHTWPKR